MCKRYQQYRPTVLKTYNNCCAWCGIESWGAASNARGDDLCLDHVKTQYTGGSDALENLQLLCRRCNSIKGEYTLPKLPPRMPAPTLAEALAAQEKLKTRIMPMRRKSSPKDWKPRSALGY